jgi:hypothetical protein
MLHVRIDRDSVHAGDDFEPHVSALSANPTDTLASLLQAIRQSGWLPGIARGEATWVIESSGGHTNPIGVLAQQWSTPKLTVPLEATLHAHFGVHEASLNFRYWCQADPELVFECITVGRELPSRYQPRQENGEA